MFMKNCFIRFVSAIAVCVTLASCSEEPTYVVNGASFEIQSYDDFLWKKDVVDTIKFELTTAFQECQGINEPITLALCDSYGEPVSSDVVTLYVGGVISDANIVTIYPKSSGTTVTDVALVIDRAYLSEDCTFDWCLKVLEAGDIWVYGERGTERYLPDQRKVLFGTDIHIVNDHVVNKMKVAFNIVLLVIAGILAAWFIMLRPLFISKFKLKQLVITGSSYYQTISLKGYRKVVCTKNRKNKQGFMSRLFLGPIYYAYNEYWDRDMEIVPGPSKTARVQCSSGYMFTPSKTLKLGVEYEMTKENGETAKIIVM